MKGKMPLLVLTVVLAGCASDGPRHADASLRPADRAECQVSSPTDGLPREAAAASAAYQRCHPGERLEWSSERSDTIKPDFSGKRDD